MPERVSVFMNESSGSCQGRRQEILDAFEHHNLPCEILPMGKPTTLRNRVRTAASQPGALVVAAGGDGTINGIASALVGTGFAFGVLPLGTLNHFAKDLGMPLDLPQAVAILATCPARPADAAEVNGHIFVNNSSIGFYPGMVRQRERLKQVGLNKWLSLTLASAHAFISFRRLSLCLNIDGQQLMRTTPFLFVGNNEYVMEGMEAGSRKRMDGGRLYLYLAPGATRWHILLITVAALFRRVQQAEHFESLCVESFTVDRLSRRGHVSLDGEIKRLPSPLHYRIRPASLSVVAPPPAAPASQVP